MRTSLGRCLHGPLQVSNLPSESSMIITLPILLHPHSELLSFPQHWRAYTKPKGFNTILAQNCSNVALYPTMTFSSYKLLPLTLRRRTWRSPLESTIWLSPTASKTFATTPASLAKVHQPIGEQPLRACGVPDTATENGSRSPRGILRPEAW